MRATLSGRRLGAMALTIAIGVSLASIGSASVASAAVPKVTGKWSVTYGALTEVKIKSTGHHTFAMSALAPIEITGGSTCRLPVGTVIATFSGKGTTFSGQHGTYYNSNCAFAAWTTFTVTALNATSFVGHLGSGETHTYTRVIH